LRALYRRASRLFDELALARAGGSYGRLLARFARTDVLVLDDWGLAPPTDPERRDLLLAAGALEVFFTQAQMKKNRPGLLLTVLAREPEAERLARMIFAETTTIGVPWQRARRWELPRREERVRTRWGTVRVKIAELAGEEFQAAPEYEDCRVLARRAGVPLRRVLLEAAQLAAIRPPRKR